MFQQLVVDVESVGENVIVTMGSSTWGLNYEAALHLSSELHEKGRLAKRFAGDLSRVYRVSGTLHDAEKPDVGRPLNPNRSYPAVGDLVKLEQIRVTQKATLVVMQLRNDVAELPYDAALTISQWIRLRSKESKARAGDARHWGKIVEQQNAVIGMPSDATRH